MVTVDCFPGDLIQGFKEVWRVLSNIGALKQYTDGSTPSKYQIWLSRGKSSLT